MPVTTRSKNVSLENSFKSVTKKEWTAAEALLFMKHTPLYVKPLNSSVSSKRPHRECATYAPGTFTDMEE